MSEELRLIRRLMARQDLSRAEAAWLAATQLREDAAGWRLLAFSVAAETKGETHDELLGILDGMARLTGPYPIRFPAELMDISSSGGTGMRKINVSTLATLVVGEPALAVAKQSFFGISSLAGSADVLAAVGIEVPRLTLAQLERALATVGIAFLSPLFLSAELRNLAQFGQAMAAHGAAVPTPYHLAVPLFTPFQLRYRMFGVNRAERLDMLAGLFRALGYHSALAVHGMDGLDEISLSSPTLLRGFRGDQPIDQVLTPEQAGLRSVPPEAVAPADRESNTRDFLRIANGVENGPKRDLVALNAGVALYLTGRADSIPRGVELAMSRLAGGGIAAKLAAVAEQVGSPDVLRQATAAALSQ
jgi:anthranilate phosphoribosyltransferase